MVLQQFWAKTEPYQSVITHGYVSGAVCRYLAKTYLSDSVRKRLSKLLMLSEAEADDFMAYLTSLHDIGKIEYYFQCMSPEIKARLKELGVDQRYIGKNHYRHEKTGEKAIRRIWSQQDQDDDSCDIFSAIIGAHHQKNAGQGSESKDTFFAEARREFETAMQKFFFSDTYYQLPPIPDEEGVVETILLGMMILSDWIASSIMFADAEDWIDRKDRNAEIVCRTEKFLRESGLWPESIEWSVKFSNLWPWIPEDGMRPLQRGAEELLRSENRYSLILMEAPMGEGKTEAGMFSAIQMLRSWKKDGFYVALPTAATSNQMVSRLRDWFMANGIQKKVRLLHGMAWIVDDETKEQTVNSEDGGEVARWLEPLRRGLLGQFSVGTIDQAMLSVTKAKYGVLRLLGLSNKVLVIDEIHSYDVYMGMFIELLLRWCKALEIPVVMLSATLPPKLKAKLLALYTTKALSTSYPLITAVSEGGSVEEYSISSAVKNLTVSIKLLPMLNDPDCIARKASELTKQGGCICVLMNTVKQAQKVFSALERCFDGELLLFHAQFPAGRRDELEKECIQKFGKDKANRPKNAILVATQVVEQSLDVDFDAMLTAVAPIDLVFQRMGRISRHDDTVRPAHLQKPTLWVLIPSGEDFGEDSYVYPEVLLMQTIHVLSEREEVRIPEDLAPLVADGYDDNKVPPTLIEEWMEHVVGEQVEAGQSRKFLIGPPDKMYSALSDTNSLFEDDGENRYLTVQTRLGEPSVRIALLEPELYRHVELCVVDGRIAPVRDKKLACQVQKMSVSITERRLSFDKSGLSYIKGDILLAGIRIYLAQNGVCELPGGRICYDAKLGVIIEEGK